MLNGIRLKNFRSLEDTGRIEFKPITLLLGQNSSGKSTFLRALPLLRQSVRTRTNSPILWYGDLVDFGSFREVLSTFSEQSTIGLTFYLNSLRIDNPYYTTTSRQANIFKDVELSITLHEIADSTRLKALSVVIGADNISIDFDTRGAMVKTEVNGRDFTRLIPKDKYHFSQTELVPQIVSSPERGRSNYIGFLRPLTLTEHEIFSFFEKRFDKRVSIGTIRALARRISYQPGDAFVERIDSVSSALKSWQSVKAGLFAPYGPSGLDELRSLYLIGLLPEILYSFSSNITFSIRELAYVGPSRATGERYYRHQELAVDQIDPQGRNLAMYLYSLTASQRDSFSDWLEQQIGYSVNVGRQGGHIQIELTERGSGIAHNLADMGYGFSQILPLMAQIWGRENRISSGANSSQFITIEQPELHLHPAYQARIADVMANSLSIRNRRIAPPRFIVETHSEAMINRLGELIYNKVIPASSVAVYLFHRLPSTAITEITKSSFDDNGSLIDWPLGFFSSKAI